MKNLSLVLLACVALSFNQLSAQNNVLRLSPLAFGKVKARIHYERALTEKVSAGIMGSYFFGAYPGFRVEPFARFYLSDDALTGFYIQGKGHYSQNSLTVITTVGSSTSEWKHSFSEYGVAGNVGWQFMLGANENIALDIYTGYRYSSLKALDNVDVNTLTTEALENRAAEIVYRALHSNYFDLGFSVGYRF